jgi:hypothetical protein
MFSAGKSLWVGLLLVDLLLLVVLLLLLLVALRSCLVFSCALVCDTCWLHVVSRGAATVVALRAHHHAANRW